jgi:hypothetical protein
MAAVDIFSGDLQLEISKNAQGRQIGRNNFVGIRDGGIGTIFA